VPAWPWPTTSALPPPSKALVGDQQSGVAVVVPGMRDLRADVAHGSVPLLSVPRCG
jgi:hypothetical protein